MDDAVFHGRNAMIVEGIVDHADDAASVSIGHEDVTRSILKDMLRDLDRLNENRIGFDGK